jgi:vacuolar-type H+-ATPase subunit I/STV1
LTVSSPDIKLKITEKKEVVHGDPEGGKMSFWERIKRDLEKDRTECGLTTGRKKTEADEVDMCHRENELKSKVRSWMADLGGRIYELSERIENPMKDMKVEMMLSRIKKLESQIRQLEEKKKKDTGS